MAGGLRRTRLHTRALAGLRQGGTRGRTRRIPLARAALWRFVDPRRGGFLLIEPANVTPEPVATPKRTSELGLRIASGLIMALLALGSAWFGDWPFGVFWT